MELIKKLANIIQPHEERGQLITREGKQFIKVRDISWFANGSEVKCELAFPAGNEYYSHGQSAILDMKAIITVKPLNK